MRIGFAWVIAAVACGGTARQPVRPPAQEPPAAAPEELPGFAVQIPEGALTTNKRDDYRAGDVTVISESGWRLMTLSWVTGLVAGDLEEEERMMVSLIHHSGDTLSLRRAFDVATPGLESITWELTSDQLSMFMTTISCGQRTVQMAFSGAPADAAAQEAALRAMVATFRCTPDPARELPLEPPRVTVAVPAGWVRSVPVAGVLAWQYGEWESVWFAWSIDIPVDMQQAHVEVTLPPGFQHKAVVTAAEPIGGHPVLAGRRPRPRLAPARDVHLLQRPFHHGALPRPRSRARPHPAGQRALRALIGSRTSRVIEPLRG